MTVSLTGSIELDGDDCFDVEEAGFDDPDNDGVLCTGPVVVDGVGKVVCIADGACEDDLTPTCHGIIGQILLSYRILKNHQDTTD